MNTFTTDDTSRSQPRRIVRILRAAIFGAAVVATAVALFYAEENWRGERAWAVHVKAMAALGEHLDQESFLPAPVPDDQNFAKTPVLDALAYQPKSPAAELVKKLRSIIFSPGPNDSWSQGQPVDWQNCLAGLPAEVRSESLVSGLSPAAQVLAILKPLEPVMAELRAAARARSLGQFRSNLTPGDPFSGLNIDGMFGLSRLLGIYVAAELAEGRTEQAFEDTLVLHRLVAAIGADGGTLLELLVYEAICNGSEMQIFWEGWRDARWAPAQYEAMQSRFGAWDGPVAYNRALRRERAFVNRIFSGSKSSVPWADLGVHQSRRFPFMPSGWWRQNLITYNLAMQQALANGFDETPPRFRSAEVARLTERTKEMQASSSPFLWLAAIGMTNHGKLVSDFAGKANLMPMAGVVCALERYKSERGEYPETLEALVPKFAATLPTDIYMGQPFRYRRTADGQFQLYSVGPDEKDDSGVKGDDWAWPARLGENRR